MEQSSLLLAVSLPSWGLGPGHSSFPQERRQTKADDAMSSYDVAIPRRQQMKADDAMSEYDVGFQDKG
jgi:hypothetical protein